MLRVTTFLLIIMSFFRASVSAGEITRVTTTISPNLETIRSSNLTYSDGHIFLLGSFIDEKTELSEGMFAKIEPDYKNTFYNNTIDKNGKTIVPSCINILEDGNIEILSAYSLSENEQILSVKRFRPDGEEIYSYDAVDASFGKNSPAFPIKKTGNKIRVCYTVYDNNSQTKSYSVLFDQDGKKIASKQIDSSYYSNNNEQLTKYEIHGFDIANNGQTYCYGKRTVTADNFDSTSTYIIKLNGSNEIAWRRVFYDTNNAVKINSICAVENNNLLVAVREAGTSYLYKFSSDNDLLWKTELNNQFISVTIEKMITNSEGNYVMVGSASNFHGEDLSKDHYIAGFDINGNKLWQEKDGLPFEEVSNDIVESAPNQYYISGHRKFVVTLQKLTISGNSVNQFIENDPKVKLYHSANIITVEKPLSYQKAELIDFNGRNIESYSIANQTEFTINKDKLANGAYFLRLSSQEKSTVKKFIK